MNDRASREFDLVVMGATGFTGRLVVENLRQRIGVNGEVRWALAGRNPEALEALRSSLGDEAAGLPLIQADSLSGPDMQQLAARCRLVLTTVGPYAQFGTPLVVACSRVGTDYVDLCGEVPWMQSVYDQCAELAEQSGARIVHCCGFDSIPSDLGVWLLQHTAMQRQQQPLSRVRGRVLRLRGSASGGTVASMLGLIEAAQQQPEIASILKNPYALAPKPGRKGIRQPYVSGPMRETDPISGEELWLAPFVMAAINSRVVLRSNRLLGNAWGEDFRYDEAQSMGSGWRGRRRAWTVSAGLGAFVLGARSKLARRAMQRWMLPEPGQGPSAEEQLKGGFDVRYSGVLEDGTPLGVRVSGDRDPGYGATSRMISEAALCLLQDPGTEQRGGFWTPASAMAEPLRDRLQQHAGMGFRIEG